MAKNIAFYWNIDATSVAEFDSLEEAEKELASAPPVITIHHGHKAIDVRKEDIHIHIEEYDYETYQE